MLCLAALAQAYSFAAIRSATMIVVTFVGTDGISRSTPIRWWWRTRQHQVGVELGVGPTTHTGQ